MNRAALLLLALAACVQTVPENDRSCPCAPGWQCCPAADVCVPEGERCPSAQCVPDCAGKCGPDGCGGTCGVCTCGTGTCPGELVCTPVLRCGTIKDAGKPPKVMLVLDKSGSMKSLTADDTKWGCTVTSTGSGYSPTGDCKWNTLKRLIGGAGELLDSVGSQARIGLAVFPNPDTAQDACRPGAIEVPVPAEPASSTAAIRAKLDSYLPGGGTPSADVLRALASTPSFIDAEPGASRIAVLVTDGLPNCNAAISSCQACSNAGGDPNTSCGDKRNCVDSAELIDAIKQLRAAGALTVVVGFGQFTSSPVAADVLDHAAVEGGMPNVGGGTSFYRADDEADLRSILRKLLPALSTCSFSLSQAPKDPDSLQVVMTDTTVAAPDGSATLARGTDWDYLDGSNTAVTISGDRCTRIQTADPGRYRLSFLELTEL